MRRPEHQEEPIGEEPHLDPEMVAIVRRAVQEHRPNIVYNGNGAPRWRVILEVVIAAAIVWLAERAYQDVQFQTNMTDNMAALKAEVDSIAKVVHPSYTYRGGNVDD